MPKKDVSRLKIDFLRAFLDSRGSISNRNDSFPSGKEIFVISQKVEKPIT